MESFDFCARLSLLLATQPCIYLFSLGRSYFASYGRVKIFALSTTFAAWLQACDRGSAGQTHFHLIFWNRNQWHENVCGSSQVVSRTAAAVGSGSCWLPYPSATSSRPQLLCDLGWCSQIRSLQAQFLRPSWKLVILPLSFCGFFAWNWESCLIHSQMQCLSKHSLEVSRSRITWTTS